MTGEKQNKGDRKGEQSDVPVDEPPSTAAAADKADRDTARRELHDMAEHFDPHSEAELRDAGPVLEQATLWGDAARRFVRNRIAMVALIILTTFTLLSIFAPMVSKYEPNAQKYPRYLEPGESPDHWLGTDKFGRDLWTRAWVGGRMSLAIAFTVALSILVIGLIYGSISGYAGGRVDNAMMRGLDALYGLPYLPFAIIFSQVMKSLDWVGADEPLLYMVPALTATTWFTAARIIRGQVLSLKENEYVDAARATGAKGFRIISRHLIPNTLGVLIIAVFLEVPAAILGEALLSYLGLGVDIPAASWGSMAQEGSGLTFETHPHMMYIPVTLIAVTVLCAVAIADGLRDALDPRGRE